MQSFRIKQAESADEICQMRRLFEEYAEELDESLCFQNFQDELASLPGLYGPPRGKLLIALSGGAAAGCVALRPIEDGYCEMKRLYVRPQFRGNKLGRKLAEEIIGHGQQLGYSGMRLDTLQKLGPALRLYEQLGFKPTAPYNHNPLPGVVYLELNYR